MKDGECHAKDRDSNTSTDESQETCLNFDEISAKKTGDDRSNLIVIVRMLSIDIHRSVDIDAQLDPRLHRVVGDR